MPETLGNWRKEDIIEVSWKYIQDTKKEFAERAKAVEKETGDKVKFNYTHFHTMTPEEKTFQQQFLKARLKEDKNKEHIDAFLKDLEDNRKILATAEEKAKDSWDKKKENKKKEVDVTSEIELYGTKIRTKRLGVLLDNSGSMSAHLTTLRAEIKKQFPNAYFIEVYGSAFRGDSHRYMEYFLKIGWHYVSPNKDENPFLKAFYCQQIPEENPHYFVARLEQDNVAAMAALSQMRRVDALYWFSDMKDRVDSKIVERLEALLKRNKTRVYAHTVSKYPTRALSKMIKSTGGKVIRKKFK